MCKSIICLSVLGLLVAACVPQSRASVHCANAGNIAVMQYRAQLGQATNSLYRPGPAAGVLNEMQIRQAAEYDCMQRLAAS